MSAGQALERPPASLNDRHAWLRHLLAVLVALPLLLGLAGAVVVWRLSQGPLELGFLARLIEAQANRGDAPGQLRIGSAAVGWAGFRGEAPLDIRLSGVTLRDGDGSFLGALPDGSMTLALRPLLRGVLAPSTIEMRAPDLLLRRNAEGHLAFDLGGLDELGPEGKPDATAAMLADLLRPVEDRASHTSIRSVRILGGRLRVRDAVLGRDWALEELRLDLRRAAQGGLDGDGEAQLRLGEARVPVHVSGQAVARPGGTASYTVRLDLPLLHPSALVQLIPEAAPLLFLDAPLAVQLTGAFDGEGEPQGVTLGIQAPQGGLIRLTPKAALPFRRLEARLTGNADRLVVEDARFALDGSEMLGSGELRRGDGGWAGRLSLGLDALDAAAVPTIWPEGLAPQTRRAVLVAVPRGRVSDVRVTLDLEADGPWREFRLAGGGVAARLEAALIDLGPRSQVAAERLDFALRLGRESFVLDHASLTLPAPARGVAPTTISAGGEARLADGRWRGGLNVMLDRVRLGDLPKLWPEGLGGNERPWITSNITAGEVTGGAWRIEAEAGTEFDDVTPTRVTGEATVAGATVHWLRPIPPMRGVAGRVRFGLEEIAISLRSGRQDREGEQPGSLETRDATMRILLPPGQVPSTEIIIGIAGPLTETVAVLRHPRLRLFERRPFPVQVAGGTQEGVVSLAFPLVSNLATSQVRVRAETRIRNARLTRAVLDRDLEDLDLQLVTDTEQLRVSGTGSMIGVPLRLGVEMEFRPGPATQVVARESVSLRLDAVKLDELGFGAGALLAGPVALEIRTERRRNNQSTVALRGDLRDAVLSFTPLNWTKPRGTPGSAEALLRLNGDALTAIDNIRIDTQDVALRGRAIGRAGRVERIEVSESQFGGSRFVGDARAPSTGAGIWAVDLRGPVLDLRPIFGSPGQASRDRRAQREGPEGGQPPLLIDLRFDHALMGPGRDIFGLQARGRTDASGVMREATLRARTTRDAGSFELTLTPQGETRQLRGTAEDGGGLLRAFGIVETIEGGRMTLNARYADSRPATPLTGVAELDQFSVRNAVALGKLLQAMTLYGLVEAAQGGGGLAFSRAVVPFGLTATEFRMEDARAFSASLGLTARGRVLRGSGVMDLEGTIVPAYFFNSLLGNLPLVGRLFSPEAGGGVFAATFRARGPAEDAEIVVNPLAALTPGFLRGLFGLAEAPRR